MEARWVSLVYNLLGLPEVQQFDLRFNFWNLSGSQAFGTSR